MTLLFISSVMGVPYTTARRALAKLGIKPQWVGNAYALSDAEAVALAEYLAKRLERRIRGKNHLHRPSFAPDPHTEG
jgi:hypothetical protein